MNIGHASKVSNLPAKTIRYYEDIHLINPSRNSNGYRDYSESDIHRLTSYNGLARSALVLKNVDFSYLSMMTKPCQLRCKIYCSLKITEIDRKIDELKSLRHTLSELAHHCHGNDKPDCPILDGLAMEHKSVE